MSDSLYFDFCRWLNMGSKEFRCRDEYGRLVSSISGIPVPQVRSCALFSRAVILVAIFVHVQALRPFRHQHAHA